MQLSSKKVTSSGLDFKMVIQDSILKMDYREEDTVGWPQAKFYPLAVFLNKVLLAHNHVH